MANLYRWEVTLSGFYYGENPPQDWQLQCLLDGWDEAQDSFLVTEITERDRAPSDINLVYGNPPKTIEELLAQLG